MTDKAALREQAIAHRDRIRPEDEDIENVSTLFFDHVDLSGKIISVYWPMGKEFDSRYLIQDLMKTGKQIAIPVPARGGRVMSFRLWDGKTNLTQGSYGTMIPPEGELVEPDILVIPFLAFDRKGHRLGRGAGHYDATIASLRSKKEILTIGVGYAAQAVLFNLPAEEHDQPLDMVITPSGVHDFRL